MANYTRKALPFIMKGINITQPGDRIGPQYAQIIQNMRCLRIGEWRQRPGMTRITDGTQNGLGSPIRSIIALNNEADGTFRRIVGTANGNLYIDNANHNGYLSPITGFSGDPMTSALARPERSPYPYALIADRQKMGKVNSAGVFSEWGLTAPKLSVSAELAQIAYKNIEPCDTVGDFTADNATIAVVDRVPVGTSVSRFLFDVGNSGWVSIVPTALDESIQPGMQIKINNVETIVDSVYQAITNTSIASISYDSLGASGNCTIQLTTPSTGLKRDSVLLLTSGGTTELIRVLSVTLGPTGFPSIRAFTTNSFTTGTTVAGQASFRVYLPGSVANGQSITSSFLQLTTTADGLSKAKRFWGSSQDLTTVTLGNETRPVTGDDYIHISVKVSDFSKITEIQLQLDFDDTNDNTTRFTRNYYFKSIRQPDFQGVISQTSPALTSQQVRIQRQQLDAYTRQALEEERNRLYQEMASTNSSFGGGLYGFDDRQSRINEIDSILNNAGYGIGDGEGPLSISANAGANQWTELKIPLNTFQRVGSDNSRGWRDIRGLQVTVQGGTGSASTVIGIDSIWIGGSYGMTTQSNEDVTGGSQLVGINYVYRARNTVTGSRSNPSPPMRSALFPQRQGVTVNIPGGYPDSQADVYDVFRIGGTLTTYHLVASVPSNGSNTVTFVDVIPDDVAITYPLLENDRFKPWIRPDVPRSGTCRVVGTSVTWLSGDVFNTNWVRGNQILIDGRVYTLYAPPGSSTRLELNESAGNIASATFSLPEPMMDGQPLPVVFGPFGTGVSGEFFFGMGDPVNPGYLYWTNGNDPESCGDVNILEISGPSEPLLGGTIIDGIIFVWSDRRSWRIFPSFSGGASGGGSQFYAQETAMGKGLTSRWGVTVGDQIYFISWDGIYATRGDAVTSLTDETLAPIFRRDATDTKIPNYGPNVLAPLGSLLPISFATADLSKMRLTYSKDGLYFHYKSIAGPNRTLYYSFLTQGWVEDTYTTDNSDSVILTSRQYGGGRDQILIGTETGKLLTYGQSNVDADYPIPVRIVTCEETWDDSRALKQLGDFMLDLDPGAANISISQRLWYDNGRSYYDTGQPIQVTSQNLGRQRFIRTLVDNTNEANLMRRSVALDLSWTTHSFGQTVIYEWQPAAILKTETITPVRYTDWERPANGRNVWLQGMTLAANTFGVTGDLVIQGDDGTGTVISINHNGEETKPYVWEPFITHQVRIACSVPWQFFGLEFVYKSEPEKVVRWHTQNTSLGMVGYAHIRDMLITHQSSADITLQILVDGIPGPSYTIPASNDERTKTYLPIRPLKGKLFQFILTSTEGFRLYLQDCEVRIKPWGLSQSNYITARPFGDGNFDNGDGARI